MTDNRGVLFVPYRDRLGLLGVEDALRICEQVYAMHARGSIAWASPASFKLDVAEDFNNHWHAKAAFLKEVPTTGVRLYNYYDDGTRNTIGELGCTRYIVLSEPHSGEPVAIVDELGATPSVARRPRRSPANGWDRAARKFWVSSASARWG